MSQPAFDFGDDELDDAANPTYTVGELADAINDTLRRGFSDGVWVRGEIAAVHWPHSIDPIPTPDGLFTWVEVPSVTRARILIAFGSAGSLKDAAGQLGTIPRLSEKCRFIGQTIEVAVLQALVLAKQGRGAQALDALEEALAMADFRMRKSMGLIDEDAEFPGFGEDVPAGARNLTVQVGVFGGTGSVWLDNVQFEAKDHPTPFVDGVRLPHLEYLAESE